MINIVVMLTLL